MRQKQATLALRLCALAVAVPALGGNDCRPVQPVGQLSAGPTLTDERGDPDPSGFAALVESVERARRLRFIRRPELVVVDPSAPELAALEQKTRALAPMSDAKKKNSTPAAQAERTRRAQTTRAPRAFPDFDRVEVIASSPPDLVEVRRALGRLLDGQHYPRLVEAASRLPGDGGIAIRALLAASANAMAGGSWFPGGLRLPQADAPLNAARIEGVIRGQPVFDTANAPLHAAALLLALDDPETAFRNPPLSTKQLLSPAAYLASDRPLRLVGSPPVPITCQVLEDESVGVLRLLVGLSASGASVTSESLARWKGDRLLRLSCDDGRAPWIYIAEFSREPAPHDFEAEIDALLPLDLARPLNSVTLGRRIAAWSGMDTEVATTFARGLASHEVRDFGEWLP
jgi:hypothetical protein